MQCIATAVPPNKEIMGIITLINDTAIFLAINYRILGHTAVTDSLMARLRVSFGGTGLSTLSQVLLESGQHFYLIAVATNVALLVLLKLPQLSPVYHSMFSVPAFALINAMACLVFWRIKFGLISSDGTTKIPTSGRYSDFHATPNSRPLPLHYLRTDPAATKYGPRLFLNLADLARIAEIEAQILSLKDLIKR
ncbi:hypothetical protein C8R45DRAFT_1111927 [Mycena sanguinolenta]|nr:hypothetical protein C8R45DRAFT_1111927 [Mycena sanguinolenta]